MRDTSYTQRRSVIKIAPLLSRFFFSPNVDVMRREKKKERRNAEIEEQLWLEGFGIPGIPLAAYK